MTRLHPTTVPPQAPGLASLVLGSIGLLLFFLPILGIPISGIGLVFGIAGLLAAAIGAGRNSLKWCAVGIAVCLFALATNLAIAFAPAGYIQSRPPMEMWQPIPNRPYVPPPAPAGEPR